MFMMVSSAENNEVQAKPVDVDAILNRARVNLARSQKLVEGWIPLSQEERERQKAGDLVTSNVEDEFEMRPERAGLGADLSKLAGSGLLPGSSGGTEIEKLRKQMLGRKTAKPMTSSVKSRGLVSTKPGDKHPKRIKPAVADPGSEDEGRASSFRSKRVKSKGSLANTAGEPQMSPVIAANGERSPSVEAEASIKHGPDGQDFTDEHLPSLNHEKLNEATKASRVSSKSSFLDQILAERSKKKKKKKQKKQQGQNE